MKLRNLSIYKILEIGLEIHRLAFMDVFAVGQTWDVSFAQMISKVIGDSVYYSRFDSKVNGNLSLSRASSLSKCL
jgi:hypothetical protein